MLFRSQTLAQRLWEMGALGTVGIDVISADGKAYAVEINARHNTSTPLIHALRKLSEKENGVRTMFRSFSLDVERDFSFRSFTELAGRENLLTPGGKTGLLPYHFDGCRLGGKLEVAAFAADEDGLDRLLRLLPGASI